LPPTSQNAHSGGTWHAFRNCEITDGKMMFSPTVRDSTSISREFPLLYCPKISSGIPSSARTWICFYAAARIRRSKCLSRRTHLVERKYLCNTVPTTRWTSRLPTAAVGSYIHRSRDSPCVDSLTEFALLGRRYKRGLTARDERNRSDHPPPPQRSTPPGLPHRMSSSIDAPSRPGVPCRPRRTSVRRLLTFLLPYQRGMHDTPT
jgi:hypothetical protein